MATLAQVTRESRFILKLLGITFGVVFVVFILAQGSIFIKNALFPSPPPPPEQKFGKLPEIDIPNQDLKIKFKINTINGGLPQFPDRMTVYKTDVSEPRLASLKDARSRIANLGLTLDETKLTNSLYQWRDKNGSIIQYDILTNNFNFLLYSFNSNSAPSEEKSISSALTFLSSLGENLEDINFDKTSYDFYIFRNGGLEKVTSRAQAEYTRVNLFQNDIEKYPVYYPGPGRSTMHLTVNGGMSIAEANFNHHTIDSNQKSTYPIIAADAAFKKLQEGDALIFNNSKEIQIDITDVSLGYLIGVENQKYFLPIAIFSGKDFQSYVSLIPDSSLIQAGN